MKCLLLLLIVLPFSYAHLAGGEDKEVGPYLLDAGWDPERPIVGESTSFAVNIVDSHTFTPSNFSSVLIRLSKNDEIFFAGNLELKGGSASFAYTFPEGGEWDLEIQFGQYKEKIDVSVRENSQTHWIPLAIIAIAILGYFAITRMKK